MLVEKIGGIITQYYCKFLGMPSNKMKLKTSVLPQLKDNASVAYYNFRNGSVIDLSIVTKKKK